MYSGKGGARHGISWVCHVFNSLHEVCNVPFNRWSWSCSPARVSEASPRPAPVTQRCSGYSAARASIRSRCRGSWRWFSWRNCRKAATALSYLIRVAGWTVSSLSVPNWRRCWARIWGSRLSTTRLDISEFGTDRPAAGFIRRVLVRMDIAPYRGDPRGQQ